MIFLSLFLIWFIWISLRKKTLINFCSPLKKVFFFEIWNLEFRIWKLKFGIQNLKLSFWKNDALCFLINLENLFFLKLMSSIFENIFLTVSLKIFEKFFFIYFLKKGQNEEKFILFFFVCVCVCEELTQQLWSLKGGGGANFWPPFSFVSFSFYAFPSSLFSLPPLLLFTLFFHLHFLPHYTISSLENHFPKFLNLLSFISLNHFFRSLCSWPLLLQTHFWIPSPNFHFFALIMASSKTPSSLTFNGKKYHPSLEWNEEEGLLQDPKTHAPHSKMDFKVSFIFLNSFVGKFGDFMFYWGLGVETLSFDCYLLILKFCIVWLIML